MELNAWLQQVCSHARAGNKPIVCQMLTDRGLHIAKVSLEGRSILHFAIASGNADLVTTLLSFRCNPNRIGPFGNLPLGLAAKAGFDDVVLALATGGADLNLQDNLNNTCLDYLKERGDRTSLLLQLQKATGLVACRLGCGAVLPPSELGVHESSTCKNSSVACPYCYDIFTINDFTNQHDCKAEPVLCPNCNTYTTAGALVQHELICMKTVTYECEQCHDQVLVRIKIKHRKTECMERIIYCGNDCGVQYKAKERTRHVLNDCSRRVSECIQCQGHFEHRDLKEHQMTTCPARIMICRFGCPNISLKNLKKHEANHIEKDLLLFTPEELLWWIELNETFRGDIQLGYRVKRIFCERAFFNKKHPKTFTVHGEVGGIISGKLLSSLYREKLYQLLVNGGVERMFSKQFVEKLGSNLKTSCPRKCGEIFLLNDRKEHVDFCKNGMSTCVRCGSSIVRKNMKLHRVNECQSTHVRWWPKSGSTGRVVSGGVVSGGDVSGGGGGEDNRVEEKIPLLFNVSTTRSTTSTIKNKKQNNKLKIQEKTTTSLPKINEEK